MRAKLLAVIGCLLVSGCSTMGLTEQKIVKVKATGTDKGLEIASFPTQLRGAYVYTDGEGNKFVCAEPFADVAASSSLNATVNAINNLSGSLDRSLDTSKNNSLSGGNSSENNEGSTNRSLGNSTQSEQSVNLGLNAINEIVALEGRTQFVLLAREMLFRTCEAAANGKLESEDSPVAKQHEHIFIALTKMIDTQKSKAEAKKAEADAERAKAILKVADKLDPKILNVFVDDSLNEVILDSYLKKYDNCIVLSGGDSGKKKKCKDTYRTNLKRLSGS